MTESVWTRAAAYAAVAIVAVASWAVAQINVDQARATLPVVAYIDCLEQFATIEWPEQPGRLDGEPSPNPSASEVCKDLNSRQTAD